MGWGFYRVIVIACLIGLTIPTALGHVGHDGKIVVTEVKAGQCLVTTRTDKIPVVTRQYIFDDVISCERVLHEPNVIDVTFSDGDSGSQRLLMLQGDVIELLIHPTSD